MDLARRAAQFGVAATVDLPNADALRARTQTVVHAMREMNLDQFRASGMDLVIGRARFVAPRRVEVATENGTRLLEGEHAVIDLGTRPAIPRFPALPRRGP